MRIINKMAIQPNTPNDNRVLWLNGSNASYYNNGTWVTIGKSSEDGKELEEKVDSLDKGVDQVNKDLKRLDNRSSQMEESIKNISVTGGASVAEAVTYDNTTSGLESVNVKGAVDELQGSKIDKTSILQEIGEAEDKVMSQKSVSDKLSDLGKNVNTVMSITDFNWAVSCGFFHTNLCNQNDPDFTDGYFLTDTGNLQQNELTAATGFIPFTKEMKSLVCSVDGKLNVWSIIYTVLYDINKKFISATAGNKNVVWQEGVVFARFSLQKTVDPTDSKHYQVEVGTEPTPYIEYGKAIIKDVVKVVEKNIANGSVTSEKIANGVIRKKFK